MVTRPLRGWFHWQAQQADRSEKVIEEQQHELAEGLRDLDEGVAVVVRVLRASVLVFAEVVLDGLARRGHPKSRSRKASEAEGEQTWRTRWTTWPGHHTQPETGETRRETRRRVRTRVLVVVVEHPSGTVQVCTRQTFHLSRSLALLLCSAATLPDL